MATEASVLNDPIDLAALAPQSKSNKRYSSMFCSFQSLDRNLQIRLVVDLQNGRIKSPLTEICP
jgi:hypothetical protein